FSFLYVSYYFHGVAVRLSDGSLLLRSPVIGTMPTRRISEPTIRKRPWTNGLIVLRKFSGRCVDIHTRQHMATATCTFFATCDTHPTVPLGCARSPPAVAP